MKIFTYFHHIHLTNDQRNALNQLNTFLESNEQIFILQGYAGTGKTTLLKGIVEYLKFLEKKYQLMAPTGRAAKVIHQKTGFGATTIHKGIYNFSELHEVKKNEETNAISFLYEFKIREDPLVRDSILIIDEASMVSDVLGPEEFFRFGSGCLLQDLLVYSRVCDETATSKIVFIGDPAQLPPIGMDFSPALDQQYLTEKYKLSVSHAEMKEVKRQDQNNGILLSAIRMRQNLISGYFNHFDLRENQKDIFNPTYQDYLEVYKAQQGQKIIICYKNKTALNLNTAIRKNKFSTDLHIQPSDIVVINKNNYCLGIMNGEFAIVANVNPSIESRKIPFNSEMGKKISIKLSWRNISLLVPDENNQPKVVHGLMLENFLYGDNHLRHEEQRALYIDFKIRHPKLKEGTEEFRDAIFKDEYFNCIMLKYGYAVTCHKAQGGEWDSAFVFWDKGTKTNFNFQESEHSHSGKANSDFFRWAYTAITRASNKLFCINPPYFSAFSEMSFIDVNVQHAFDNLTGKIKPAHEIPLDEVIPTLHKFGLTDAPLSIQNHFIYRWYHLKKHSIDIEKWQKVNYEIRYVFNKDSQTAAFKYWVNKENVFKPKFQKIPSQTNSDKFFNDIVKILENATPIEVIRSETMQGALAPIQFDKMLEKEKPFLKNLFDVIQAQLSKKEIITNIQHLQNKERYSIERNGKFCVIDFEYNDAGFFGRVLPLEKRCNSPEILSKIKYIVNSIKIY
jgi:tRNA A37 threonylcarbamoyladenosine biosynthesis protein TsaE